LTNNLSKAFRQLRIFLLLRWKLETM